MSVDGLIVAVSSILTSVGGIIAHYKIKVKEEIRSEQNRPKEGSLDSTEDDRARSVGLAFGDSSETEVGAR